MEDVIAVAVFIAFFGLLDLLWWVLAIYFWGKHFIFMSRAVRIEGRVVSVRRRSKGDGAGVTIYSPVVRFEDEHGQAHKAVCQAGDPMWEDLVDTPLDVLVIPGRPETAKVSLDKRHVQKVMTILAVAFALPVVLLSLALNSVLQGG